MIYRKRGSVLRWENGARIRVDERGMAHETEDTFFCEPDPASAPLPPFTPSDLDATAALVRFVAAQVSVERLLLVEGVAAHEYDDVQWEERTTRMHVALTHASLRVLLDLASFDVEAVERTADALLRVDLAETRVPDRIRTAPAVTAALLPILAGSAWPGARVVQTAGGRDGRGRPVIEAERDWPNWYRPSYRVRPVRVPMNLRIEPQGGAIDATLPSAVALLGPPAGRAPELLLHVLLDDGTRTWPARVPLRKLLAATPPDGWYPYGAGSFGAEMVF